MNDKLSTRIFCQSTNQLTDKLLNDDDQSLIHGSSFIWIRSNTQVQCAFCLKEVHQADITSLSLVVIVAKCSISYGDGQIFYRWHTLTQVVCGSSYYWCVVFGQGWVEELASDEWQHVTEEWRASYLLSYSADHTHTHTHTHTQVIMQPVCLCACVYRKRITVMRALCQQLLPSPLSLLITACLDS